MSTIILINGALKIAIWLIGAAFTFYRRRGWLCVGFAGAAVTAAIRTAEDAHSNVVTNGVLAGFFGTVIAAAIVASFIDAQRGSRGRGERWTR